MTLDFHLGATNGLISLFFPVTSATIIGQIARKQGTDLLLWTGHPLVLYLTLLCS